VSLDYVYKITSGNTGNAFTIDTLSGVITVNDYEVINFETTPTYNPDVSVTFYLNDDLVYSSTVLVT
jgi:hypothetical protein